MNMTKEEWQKMKYEMDFMTQHETARRLKMKIIAALIVVFLLLCGMAMVSAQDVTPQPQKWTIRPARDVYWIGENIMGTVNGSANTSFTIELRPIINGTVKNATYQKDHRTSIMGMIPFVVEAIDVPGDYRLQVLVNGLVVAYVPIRFDFSFERWVAIQFEKRDDRFVRIEANATEDDNNDALLWRYAHKLENGIFFLAFLVIVIILIQLPRWLARYGDYATKSGKGSLKMRILSKDRTMDYGGAIISNEEPRMPQAFNETNFDEWNLSNKTHDEVIDQINKNVHRDGYKVPPKTQFPPTYSEILAQKKAKRAAKPKGPTKKLEKKRLKQIKKIKKFQKKELEEIKKLIDIKKELKDVKA